MSLTLRHAKAYFQASGLHRAVTSILDVALQFSHSFVSFAGDGTMTHDLSVTRSFTIKQHRSRRRRRQRRNVIGSTDAPVWRWEEEEDSSDEEADEEGGNLDFIADYSSFGENAGDLPDSSPERIEKLSKELDSLVKSVRRGVETLAESDGDMGASFGVLAFSLEDWDQ